MRLPAATSRLRFRELAFSDALALGTVPVPRDPLAWVEWNRRSYAEHGIGMWALETHDGDVVGDCGLTLQPVEGDHLVEIGWHTVPELRGRGYAAEAATSVLATAQDSGLSHVVAIIAPENRASQRVAEKVGLTVERQVDYRGSPALLFGVSW